MLPGGDRVRRAIRVAAARRRDGDAGFRGPDGARRGRLRSRCWPPRTSCRRGGRTCWSAPTCGGGAGGRGDRGGPAYWPGRTSGWPWPAPGSGPLAAFTAPPSHLPGRTLAAGQRRRRTGLRQRGLAGPAGCRPAPTPAAAPPTPWHLMPVATVLAPARHLPDGLASDRGATGAAAGPGADRRRRRGRACSGRSSTELANPLTPVLAAGAALSAAVGSLVDAALVGGVIGGSALIGAVHRAQHRTVAGRTAVPVGGDRPGTAGRGRSGSSPPTTWSRATSSPSSRATRCPPTAGSLEAAGLEADESSLTGESLPVAKSSRPGGRRRHRRPTLDAVRGHAPSPPDTALAVVVATGADTETGRSMALARQAPPASGVEARLERAHPRPRSRWPPVRRSRSPARACCGAYPLAASAGTAANLAVASVPEGLPFLVSAAQLAAARRLAGHGALVRNPRTIEALGRVDVLCFDKTGTLTEGQLLLPGSATASGTPTARRAGRPAAADPGRGAAGHPDADRPEEVCAADRPGGPAGAPRRPGWCSRPVPPVARPPEAAVRAVPRLPRRPSAGPTVSLLLSVKGAPETVLAALRRGAGATGARSRWTSDPPRRLRAELDRPAGAGRRVLAVAERTANDPRPRPTTTSTG